MPSSTPLPPHLERFVRQQIATGCYDSEDDLIRAALRLLEASSASGTPTGSRPDRHRELARPAAGERWETPGEWLTDSPPTETTPPSARRSPRGLLADLRSGISPDDIREARSELWAGLHRGA
jgi:Arc/MetJ-type ribon-helix-helix transcriptional regulator